MEQTAVPSTTSSEDVDAVIAAQAEIRELVTLLLRVAEQTVLPTWSSWPTLQTQVVEKGIKFEATATQLLALLRSDAPAAERRKRFLLLDLDFSSCRRALGSGVNAMASSLAEVGTSIPEGLEMVRHRLSGLPYSLVTNRPAQSNGAARTEAGPANAPARVQALEEPRAAAPAAESLMRTLRPAPELAQKISLDPAQGVSRDPQPEPWRSELNELRSVISSVGAALQAQNSNVGRLMTVMQQTVAAVRAMSAPQPAPEPPTGSLKPSELQTLADTLRGALDHLTEVIGSIPSSPAPDPKAAELSSLVDKLQGAVDQVSAERDMVSAIKDRETLQQKIQLLEAQLAESLAEKERLSGDLSALKKDAETMRSLLQETEAQTISLASLEDEARGLKKEMEFREQSLCEMMIKQDAGRLEDIFKLRAQVAQLQEQLKIEANRRPPDNVS